MKKNITYKKLLQKHLLKVIFKYQMVFGVAIFLLVYNSAFSQNPFTPINNFNIFAENNVTMSGGDVEGGIAAGGNFTIGGNAQITANNSGTGNVYGTVGGVNYGLVANGSVVYTTGNFNINANGSNHWVKLGNLNGGSATLSGSNLMIQNGTPKINVNNTNQGTGSVVGSGIMNFSTIMTTLRASSSGYSTCTNNITPTFDIGNPSTAKVTMAANTRNIWNITGATLSSYTAITFNNQPTQTQPLIINVNVSGTYNWTIPNMNGIGRTNGARYVIFNFYNVGQLNIIGGQTVEGSILAPNGSVNKSHTANIEGQIVCINYIQSAGETHVAHFDATPAVCSTCSNVTSAGTVGSSQAACGTSYTPTNLTESVGASGGSGGLEYQWQISSDNASWSDISGATGVAYSPTSISATRYYRRNVRRVGCTTYSASNVVTITLNAIPSAPTGTGASRCGTGTVTLSGGGCAGTLNWYNVSSGGSSLGTGTSYTTSSLSSTTNYYLACSVSGCESSRTTVVATINAIPTNPSTTGATRCGTGTVVLGGGGCSGTLNWFAASSGGTSLGTGASFTTPSISTTTTYYAECSQSGCASGRVAAIATITSAPAAPTASGVSRCGTGTVVLTASGCSGGTMTWFTAASGGTNLGSGASVTSPSISATTTYYVECSVGSCVSGRTAVVATVNAIPANPTGTGASRCGPGTVTLTASGTGTLDWYAAASGGTSLATGTSFTTPSISSTTTYYVEANSSGCISSRTSVIATIGSSSAPTGTGASRCGTGTLVLNASGCSGGTLNWYTAATGGTIQGTGASFTTPSLVSTNTYYVDCTIGACTSTRTAVIATINPLPISVPTASPSAACVGVTVNMAANVSSGTPSFTYAWSGGLAATATPSFVTNSGSTGTYTVTVTDAYLCSTTGSVSFTSNAVPSIVISGTNTICSGTSTNITATPAGGSTFTYLWSNTFTAANIIVNPSANTTYTVTVTNNLSCSNTASYAITVNTCNSPPVITNFLSKTTAATVFKNLGIGTVVDYDATDVDLNTLTWSLTGGADVSKFSINSSMGFLTFNTPPNVNSPTDADLNNIYMVEITVSDGSGTDVQLLAVEITKFAPAFRRAMALNQLSGLEFSRGKMYGIIDSVTNNIYSLDTITGAVLQTITIGGATNVSWQDLACDEWYLYIGDFGNAANGARTDLKIYRIDLDDIPATGNATIPSTNVAIINFTYSDQPVSPTAVAVNTTPFDCGAMLIRNNIIHLFTKDWSSIGTGFRTKEYVLPAIPGTFSATYYGTINNLGGLVTAADNAGPKQAVLVGHNLSATPSNYAWTIHSFSGDAIYGGTVQKSGVAGMAAFGQIQAVSFGSTNIHGFIGSKKVALPEIAPASLSIFNTIELAPNGLIGVAGEGLEQGAMRYNAARNHNEYYDGLYWRPLSRQ